MKELRPRGRGRWLSELKIGFAVDGREVSPSSRTLKTSFHLHTLCSFGFYSQFGLFSFEPRIIPIGLELVLTANLQVQYVLYISPTLGYMITSHPISSASHLFTVIFRQNALRTLEYMYSRLEIPTFSRACSER